MKKIVLGFLLLGSLVSDSFAQDAKAFCWAWQSSGGKIYYKCYGPVQRLSTGYTDRREALEMVGCDGPSAESSSWKPWIKKRQYMWYTCYDRELKSYENSPDKINSWVRNQ